VAPAFRDDVAFELAPNAIVFDPAGTDADIFDPAGADAERGSMGNVGNGAGGLCCRCGSCGVRAIWDADGGVFEGRGLGGRDALNGREDDDDESCACDEGFERSICRSFASIIAILSCVL
jgi:hypothetical protein